MKKNGMCVLVLTLGLAATPALMVAQDRDQTRQDQGQYGQDRDRGTSNNGQYGSDQDRHDNDQGTWQNGAKDHDQNRGDDQGWNKDRDKDHNRVASDQDYTNSKFYKLGYQDGMHDRDKGSRHEHNRNFKNDDDHRAYDAGYEAAFGQQH